MPKGQSTIGEKIAQKRLALGLEIKEAADEIQAPVKFVEALENNQWGVFPAKIYATGFLKKYLKLLGLEEPEKILAEFNQEWEVISFKRERDVKRLPELSETKIAITPSRLGLFITALAILIVVGYFYYKLNFLRNPDISIEFPPEGYTSDKISLEIKGKTDPRADLTVNGRPIYSDQNGHFKETIALASGLNTLEFIAATKFNKKTIITRHILVNNANATNP